MPTPRKGYYTASGKRVPGTTTILGRFKDSGGLLHWAWNEGREGRELYEERDKAGDIGTAAHTMVYASIRNTDINTPELLGLGEEAQAKARNAYDMYCQWAAQSRLEIVEQEMQLVSEEYEYGGTPDAIGRIGGQYCLVDWKSANSIYVDYLLQLAAYKNLWEEHHPDKLLTGGFHLCRFSKDFGDFGHHFYSELGDAWEMFKHLRAAYEFDKVLKKRVK